MIDASTTETAIPKPLVPATGAQIKALHAIGRRRGLDHEDLRDAAGVASLKELSVVQAARLIERLQLDDHKREYEPPPPDRAARRTIKLASARQRTYIAVLFDRLGWNGAMACGWLLKRHEITDLAGGVFSSRTAQQVIVELEQALAKSRDAGNKTRSTGD